MPVYTIQVADGRKIKLESSDPDTALHDADAWAASNPAKRVPNPVKAGPVPPSGDRVAPGGVAGLIAGNRTSTGEDMLRSTRSGLAKGYVGLVESLPSIQTAAKAISQGIDSIPGYHVDPAFETWRKAHIPTLSESIAKKEIGYQPQTTAGKYAKTVGEFAPNAIGGQGSLLARGAQVVVPALISEGSGQLAEAAGLDERGQGIARVIGGLGGGLATSLRTAPRRAAPSVEESAVAKFARKAPQRVPQLQQRAAEYRAAGIEPTLADLVDESGRGVVRATASRMTPAREEAQRFAEARALNLPDRIGGQARRILSDDPRTPQQIAQDLGARRAQQAAEQFGAVRGEVVPLAPEGVQALRHPLARRAITEAAQRERDPEVRAALNRLATDALDAPATPVTVGMMDRVSRVLNGQAGAAFRSGDNDLGATFRDLGDALRTPTRQAVPGYDQALNNFAAESRLMGAAERGGDFLSRNTDEFVADLADYAPEELGLARATARRAIERAAGENVSAAPGVARRLAFAPEQQARNRSLLGEHDAQRLQDAMALEERAVQNARYVAPNTGSPTQGRLQDAVDAAGNVAQMGGQVARGDLIGSALTGAKLWLKARGINDAEAEALTRLALDPQRTDQAMAVLQARLGQNAAREFVRALPSVARRAIPTVMAVPMLAAASPADRK